MSRIFIYSCLVLSFVSFLGVVHMQYNIRSARIARYRFYYPRPLCANIRCDLLVIGPGYCYDTVSGPVASRQFSRILIVRHQISRLKHG